MAEFTRKREELLTNGIDPALRSKEILKAVLIYQLAYLCSLSTILPILYGNSTELVLSVTIIVCTWAIPFVITLIAVSAYQKAFIRTFRYGVTVDILLISSGVFTKDESTIPFSRIQNIKITNGVFDRKFGLFTAKIETAGFSGPPQGGTHRAEGYIPGLRDPRIIDKKIKEQIAKFSKIPSGLEDKVFASKDIAFDNFISYIISTLP